MTDQLDSPVVSRVTVGPVSVGPVAIGWPPSQIESSDPSPVLDHSVVRQTRRLIAERLAVSLQSEPVTDPAARRELCRSLLADLLAARARERVQGGLEPASLDEEHALAEAVMAALFGLGRLQPLIDDPDVENIEVNGHDQVWVSYADGREEPGPAVADSDEELIEILQLLAGRVGASERTFTTANPRLHVRLDDGSRLAAMAWTTPRPQIVIRRHRVRDVDLDDLIDLGTLDTCLVAFLRAALRAGKNIVVTGLQNAGKTTLIRALANEFAPMDRFATIEREYELHLHELTDRHPRIVAMEAREGSSERDQAGHRAGEVTLSDLVVDALRMNLRRIIVGEVRGGEVVPMLEAMSTGDGSLCTIHARSAHHALDRIVTLCLSAGVGMTDGFAYRLAAGSIDVLVHIDLLDESARWRAPPSVRLAGPGDQRDRRVGTPDHHDGVRAGAGWARGAVPPTVVSGRPPASRVRPRLLRPARRHLGRTTGPYRGRFVTGLLAALAGASVIAGLLAVIYGLRLTPERASHPRRWTGTGRVRRLLASGALGGRWRWQVAGVTGLSAWLFTGWPVVGMIVAITVLGLPALLSTSRVAAQGIDRAEAVAEWTRRLSDILIVGSALNRGSRQRSAPAPSRSASRCPRWRRAWPRAGPPRQRSGRSPMISATQPATSWSPP